MLIKVSKIYLDTDLKIILNYQNNCVQSHTSRISKDVLKTSRRFF